MSSEEDPMASEIRVAEPMWVTLLSLLDRSQKEWASNNSFQRHTRSDLRTFSLASPPKYTSSTWNLCSILWWFSSMKRHLWTLSLNYLASIYSASVCLVEVYEIPISFKSEKFSVGRSFRWLPELFNEWNTCFPTTAMVLRVEFTRVGPYKCN